MISQGVLHDEDLLTSDERRYFNNELLNLIAKRQKT